MRSAILRHSLVSGILATALIFISYSASAATVTGAVKGPDGAPFKGAFVNAQNTQTKITVSVLSDPKGHYHIENLPAGSYSLTIRAIGYSSSPRDAVTLTADQKATFDWSLQKGSVLWSDLSFYQGYSLMPAGKGKDLLYDRQCFECHEFQTRMASHHRDLEGWTQAVSYMRAVETYRLGARFTNDDAAIVIPYLNSVFGLNSPSTVDDNAEYKKVARAPFADEAMKIVYVTYELPGPNRFPFSAFPDKNGFAWIPYFGPADHIGRLNPKTGEVQEFRVPFTGTAGIHSAVPASDGSVWLAEQGSDRLGRWDPKTQAITEYQDENPAGGRGSKHTVRIDSKGNVWSSGSPLTKFDPKTGKFTHFSDVIWSYGIALGKDDTAWYSDFNVDGKIGKVDPETGKVTKYTVPTAKAWPRRMQVADDGTLWFAEFGDETWGKIAHFDPKTETFKEFPLPGKSPSPYAFGMDSNGRLWYSNMHEDVIGCLDPKTGKVIEYPIPFSENTMREFYIDAQNRVWFGTPTNNKVGYFYLAKD